MRTIDLRVPARLYAVVRIDGALSPVVCSEAFASMETAIEEARKMGEEAPRPGRYFDVRPIEPGYLQRLAPEEARMGRRLRAGARRGAL